MLGINKKNLKLAFLTFSVCLAGLSISDFTIHAKSDSGIEEIIFKRIVEADEKGKLESAKEDIQRVLKLNPKHIGANFYAGKYSFMSGNNKNAEKFMNRIIDDPKYGDKAKSILADMKLSKQEGKNISAVKVLISGRAYEQALNTCEEFLYATPDNPELNFQAALLECLLNNHDKAEAYSLKFHNLKPGKDANELNWLIDGWFAPQSRENEVIDNLLSITNHDLLLPPVREKIKEMVSRSGQIDKYEIFISKEKAFSDANAAALEGDLIKFYIDNKAYQKAVEILNKRPLDSLDDNLLYVELLTKSGNELKALENAGYLIDANKNEIRCYKLWVYAWVAYVNRMGSLPGKTNEEIKKYMEYGDTVLLEIKPEGLVNDEPELLLGLFKIATMIGQNRYAEELKDHVCKINFTSALAKDVLNFTDQLVVLKMTNLAMDVMQSAWNSLPENYAIPIKMAEITMDTDPEAAAKILDVVIKERPKNHKVFMMWLECLSRLEKLDDAAKAIGERLKDPDIEPVAARQLKEKLSLLSMQGADISGIEVELEPKDGEDEENESSDGHDSSVGDTLSEYEAPTQNDN